MSRLKNVFSFYVVFGLMIAGFLTTAANAQNNRNEREIRSVLRSLNSKLDDFQTNLSNEIGRSSSSRNDRQDLEDQMRMLEFKIQDFQVNFDRRRETEQDVSAIFDEARRANDIINRMSFSQKTFNFWTDVRYQLDRLGANYNVSFNWKNGTSRTPDNQNYPSGNYPNGNNRNNYPNGNGRNNYPNGNNRNSYGNNLTGTYQLDSSRSEDVSEIAENAVSNNNINSDIQRRDLEEKLESPEQIAIDVRGNQIVFASSKAAPVSIVANGQERSENINGRNVRLRATLRGDELVIASIGGETDYTITFSSTDNGNSMKVTRRVTTDYLNQTVFAESVYDKSDQTARLGIDNGNYSGGNYPDNNNNGGYSSNDPNDFPNSNNPNNPNDPRISYPRTGNYVVPNGTLITGILDNPINTKVSQNNDRFTMTVQSPNEFRGAIVEGHLTGIDRSGKVSGRSQVTFNFDRIRLRDGQTYDFAGFLQNVTNENGKTVKVGTEGEAKSSSQTKETVKRGGIGAGIGAVIGAIAGGAKGAAIGAIIGGGAGAGSVVLTGKEDLQLGQGSTITVQASSPIR